MSKKTKTKSASLERQKASKASEDGATPSAGAKLTDQQELFIREYLVDLNATQAAIRAKYSEATAQEQSSRLLSNVIIRARVQALLKEKFARIDLTAERVLLEMFRLATVDLEGAYDDDGNLRSIKEMPEDLRRAIAGIESEETYEGHGQDRTWTGYKKKLKLFDKTRALEMLGRHFKLLTDKIEINDTTGLAARLARAKKRKER